MKLFNLVDLIWLILALMASVVLIGNDMPIIAIFVISSWVCNRGIILLVDELFLFFTGRPFLVAKELDRKNQRAPQAKHVHVRATSRPRNSGRMNPMQIGNQPHSQFAEIKLYKETFTNDFALNKI